MAVQQPVEVPRSRETRLDAESGAAFGWRYAYTRSPQPQAADQPG